MKFPKEWINEYLINNIKINKIIFLLKNKGFEIKNSNIKNLLTEKNIFITKIINNKSLKKNKYSVIKINHKNKNLSIYTKFIKKNNNHYVIINKKNIKENIFFKHKKIKINNIIYFILFKNKYFLNKINNIINNTLDIKIPFNRIDCNNILGLTREISILSNTKLNFKYKKTIYQDKKNIKHKLNISFKNKNKNNYCENIKYIIIKKINFLKNKTPKYIKKRLKIIGILTKNTIINIINYITIESGQIINCFDIDKLKNKNIEILFFNKINKLNFKNINYILKNKKETLYKNYNLYNKQFFPNKKTQNIILIAPLLTKQFQYKKNNILNNNNFIEKYINNCDENIQSYFLQKIAKIINLIYGGKKEKIKIKRNKLNKNKKKTINFYFSKINKLLGFKIKTKKIIKILKKIGCKIISKNHKYINLNIPKWRNDLTTNENIIEAIIKIHGYNKIPTSSFYTKFNINIKKNKYKNNINQLKNLFVNTGYKEVINFHFTNKNTENTFFKKKHTFIKILNPISQDMSILRTSLIPGIISNIVFNISRQNNNIKLFEIGTCFKNINNKIKQNKMISAAICGYKHKNHWSIKNNKIFDFFDIKGDLEYILKKQKKIELLKIEKSNHLLFNKNLNTNIKINNKKIGIIGMLNKKIQKKFSIKYPIFIFEINLNKIICPKKLIINKISKQPSNLRDITLIINKNIPINNILETCLLINKKIIKKIDVIKIFSNDKLKKEKKKNITIRLTIQDNKKTLKEKEINKLITKCIKTLKYKFNIYI